MKKAILNAVVKLIKTVLCLNTPNRFSVELLENIDLVYTTKDDFKLKVYCPNKLNLYRAKTYFTKEPDMIRWIDTFTDKAVLLDVGANIGLYSIYAAKKGAKKVISIEPESQNFGLLNKNIYLNQLSDKISPFNIGFSNHDGVEYLFIPTFMPGMALHNLGENVNWKKESFTPDFKQSVLTFSIDSFLNKYPEFFPTHLKIDVDGIESKIIEGAISTLKDPRLREVIIELNRELKEDMNIIKILGEIGFELMSNEKSLSSSEEFYVLENYLFIKK